MKNILVAEDETAIREFVVINLERAGYNVTEADCGEAALETYEQKGGDFDIAILDIMMPGMDGLQVCKRAEKEKRLYRNYYANCKNTGNGQGFRTYAWC